MLKRHQSRPLKRGIAWSIGLGMVGLGVYLMMSTFQESLLFYKTPQQLHALEELPKGQMRVGGLVKKGTVHLKRQEDQAFYTFAIMDQGAEIAIRFQGVLPTLFREGQGIIAEGHLYKKDTPPFIECLAKTLLAKHDETYRPPKISKQAPLGSVTEAKRISS